MRNFPTTLQQLTTQQYAANPTLAVEIEWTSGTIQYSGAGSQGYTISIGDITDQTRALGTSSIATVQVVFSDVDDDFRQKFNTEQCFKVPASVSLVNDTESAPLLRGFIEFPIRWHDDKLTVDLSVTNMIEDAYIGRKLDENAQGVQTDKHTLGKAIPLCYGTVERRHAMQVRGLTDYSTGDVIDYRWDPEEVPSFKINNAFDLPQGEEIIIWVEQNLGTVWYPATGTKHPIKMRGTLDGDVFTPTAYGDRPYLSGFNTLIQTVPVYGGEEGGSTLYCESNIESMHLYSDYTAPDGKSYICHNYCYKQDGTTCYMYKSWTFLLNEQDQTYGYAHMPFIGARCYAQPSLEENTRPKETTLLFTYETYIISPGAKVWYYPDQTETFPEYKYILNLIPSDNVYELACMRTDNNGKQALTVIPSDYYELDLNDNTVYDDEFMTTVRFKIPMSSRKYEGWQSDEIFMTLKSSEGPNPVDVISHMVTKFTQLDLDSNELHDVVDKYPTDFVLREVREFMDLMGDYCFQTRMAITVDGSTVVLHYLSQEPDSDMTITASEELWKSLALSQTKETSTRVIGTWRKYDDQDNDFTVEIKNNIDVYGDRSKSINFWAYTHEELVTKSTQFWCDRMSRVWKQASVNGTLDLLPLQVYDCVTLTNTGLYADQATKGVLQYHTYKDAQGSTSANVELPIEWGTTTISPHYWMDDSGDVKPITNVSGIQPFEEYADYTAVNEGYAQGYDYRETTRVQDLSLIGRVTGAASSADHYPFEEMYFDNLGQLVVDPNGRSGTVSLMSYGYMNHYAAPGTLLVIKQMQRTRFLAQGTPESVLFAHVTSTGESDYTADLQYYDGNGWVTIAADKPINELNVVTGVPAGLIGRTKVKVVSDRQNPQAHYAYFEYNQRSHSAVVTGYDPADHLYTLVTADNVTVHAGERDGSSNVPMSAWVIAHDCVNGTGEHQMLFSYGTSGGYPDPSTGTEGEVPVIQSDGTLEFEPQATGIPAGGSATQVVSWSATGPIWDYCKIGVL